MVEDSTSGLLVNNRNIIDAVIHRSEGVEVIHGDTYQNGDAIQCTTKNTEMMRITLPKQEYDGDYIINTRWAVSPSITKALNIKILKDNVLIYDYNMNDGGGQEQYNPRIVVSFIPTSEYTIIMSTGPSATVNPFAVILDYIQLDPIPKYGLITGCNPSSQGNHPLIQTGMGYVTGNNSPSAFTTITYAIPYDMLHTIQIQPLNADMSHGVSSDATSTTVTLSHRNNSNWTGNEYFYYTVIGEKAPPYTIVKG